MRCVRGRSGFRRVFASARAAPRRTGQRPRVRPAPTCRGGGRPAPAAANAAGPARPGRLPPAPRREAAARGGGTVSSSRTYGPVAPREPAAPEAVMGDCGAALRRWGACGGAGAADGAVRASGAVVRSAVGLRLSGPRRAPWIRGAVASEHRARFRCGPDSGGGRTACRCRAAARLCGHAVLDVHHGVRHESAHGVVPDQVPQPGAGGASLVPRIQVLAESDRVGQRGERRGPRVRRDAGADRVVQPGPDLPADLRVRRLIASRRQAPRTSGRPRHGPCRTSPDARGRSGAAPAGARQSS